MKRMIQKRRKKKMMKERDDLLKSKNAKIAEKIIPGQVANMTESSGNLCFLKGIG